MSNNHLMPTANFPVQNVQNLIMIIYVLKDTPWNS